MKFPHFNSVNAQIHVSIHYQLKYLTNKGNKQFNTWPEQTAKMLKSQDSR